MAPGLWKIEVDASREPTLILGEETAWRARPQVAPDGKRLLFASYHGRQWHQPWMTTLAGAQPLPLTFGDFDGGNAVPARISVIGSDGRAYAPADRWMHADDGFDRKLQRFENHYFHCPGTCTLTLPRGRARIAALRGLDHAVDERAVDIGAKPAHADIALRSIALPERYGAWTSADLHVHMNYGGHYRHTFDSLAAQMRAEHLDVIHELIVNKEERVPDVAGFSTRPYARDGATIVQGQEYHTSYWGHLGILAPDDHLLQPGFAAYAFSALASPYPYNGVIADLAHAQHALIGYVHPFDE